MENNVLAVDRYYKIRQLCHDVKTGNNDAIIEAGELMSKLVPHKGCVFIPIPSHTGKATYTLKIAQIIASKTNGYVSNILSGPERETLYSLKAQGKKPSNVDLGMKMNELDYPPEMLTTTEVFLVDNVVSSGETYKQAIQPIINLLGKAPKILTLGYVDKESIKKLNYKPIKHSLSIMSNLPEHIQKRKQQLIESLLNETEFAFHYDKKNNGHNQEPYNSENRYMCYHDTGQFGSGTYFSTYNTSYERSDAMKKYGYKDYDKPEFIKVGDNVYRVDMDLYKNLYRVYNEKQGEILHSMCSRLNGFFHKVSGCDLGRYSPKQSRFDNSNIYQIIRGNALTLGLDCPSYMELTRMAQKHAQSENKQSFSTLFMEWNGYNGVNVCGISYFDTSTHGSVIYDLSKVSLEPVGQKPTKYASTAGHGWQHSIAIPYEDDFKSQTLADSLYGKFMGLGFDNMKRNEKIRIIKNIFNTDTDKIGPDDIKTMIWYCKDDKLIIDIIFNLMYRKHLKADVILDYDIKEKIVKYKKYQFLNYVKDKYDHSYHSNTLFEDFLSEYKFENWDCSNEDRKKYLDFIMSKMQRPLTKYEKEYIEEDYFDKDEEEVNESIAKKILRNINEANDIYNGNIQDEECPFFNKVFGDGFTIAEMTQYDDPVDRINYAADHLNYLGSGLRRAVFKLNDKYILKLAKGWHRFQTKNEYDTDMFLSGKYDLFPRIIYQSRDFTWTISEYARPLNGDEECEHLLGIPLWSKSELNPSLEGFQLWAETKGRQASRKKLKYIRQNDVPVNSFAYLDNVKYAEKGYPCDEIYSDLVKMNPWFKQLFELERHSRGDLRFGTDISQGGGNFQGKAFGVVKRNGKDTVVFMDAGFIKPYDILKTKSKYPKTTMHNIENPDFGQ